MGIAASTTGIDVIPVEKVALLERLKENKEKHEKEFTTAFRGYQKDWLKAVQKAKRESEREHEKQVSKLDKAIAAAQRVVETEVTNKMTRFPTTVGNTFGLPKPPRCYTEDYELALDLFGMFQTIDAARPGIIDLSPTDFAHYCRDDWSWKQAHAETFANYSGGVGPAGPAGPQGGVGPGPAGLFFASLDVDEDEDDE